MQRDLYDEPFIASELKHPDHSRLVIAFAAQYAYADLALRLADVFSTEAPSVIEVSLGDMRSMDRFR